jgi:hypothetical protein
MPSPHRFQAHHHFPKRREDAPESPPSDGLVLWRAVAKPPKAFGVNFHEPVLENGICRMILPGANKAEATGTSDVSL